MKAVVVNGWVAALLALIFFAALHALAPETFHALRDLFMAALHEVVATPGKLF